MSFNFTALHLSKLQLMLCLQGQCIHGQSSWQPRRTLQLDGPRIVFFSIVRTWVHKQTKTYTAPSGCASLAHLSKHGLGSGEIQDRCILHRQRIRRLASVKLQSHIQNVFVEVIHVVQVPRWAWREGGVPVCRSSDVLEVRCKAFIEPELRPPW